MAKKKKTAAKPAAKKPGKGKDMLVVTSKVKGFIRGKKMMCSADAVGAHPRPGRVSSRSI